MVVLDALEQEIASLLEEGVDGEVEGVVVGEEGRLWGVGILLQSSQVGRERELFLGGIRG